MFILDFLEKLQDKPKQARQQILWVAVFACMIIIFVFWVFSMKYSFKKATDQSAKTDLVPDITNSVQQMQSEWQDIKNKPGSNLPNVFENQEGTENPFNGDNNK